MGGKEKGSFQTWRAIGQSEYSDDENYGGHGCIDSRGNTRHNAGLLPTRGCTLDKLWRDQRYEGNAAGINAE